MDTQNLVFYKEHEWVRLEDGIAVIGISDYAQEKLGDIVYLDLPAIGDMVNAGNIVGEVESVKSTSDLYTPVGGEIIAINDKVAETPEDINTDPYGQGWLFKIKLTDTAELESLMSSEEYDDYVKEL